LGSEEPLTKISPGKTNRHQGKNLQSGECGKKTKEYLNKNYGTKKKKRETMTNVCLNKKVDVFVMPRTVCLTDGLTNLN
jgi:hypothetical protein